MNETSIMQSLYDYFTTCDFLKEVDGYKMIYVDYSKNDEVSTYSLNEVPCNPVIKTYVSGNTVNQFLFTIVGIENYGSDSNLNTANLKFYEDLSQWIKENNKNKVFPSMGANKRPNELICKTVPYMFDNSADARYARYMMQCQLIYDQKNN